MIVINIDYENIIKGFLGNFNLYTLNNMTFKGRNLSESPLGIINPYDLMELLLIVATNTKSICSEGGKNIMIQNQFHILMKHAEFMINHDLQRDKTAFEISFAELIKDK